MLGDSARGGSRDPKVPSHRKRAWEWDVVQAYMRADYNVKIENIRAIDLFILLLDNDPRNIGYSEYLMLIIKERGSRSASAP
jgi:hypothetical protein